MSKMTTLINARAALMAIGVEAEKIAVLAADQYARRWKMAAILWT